MGTLEVGGEEEESNSLQQFYEIHPVKGTINVTAKISVQRDVEMVLCKQDTTKLLTLP